jgi:hypothetical protein|tara:strand:- start:663 stop:1142 length:480 start_codon:yes stop_codon:yes gene_type:complete
MDTYLNDLPIMNTYFNDIPYDIQEKIYFMRLEKSIITINDILTRAYYNKIRSKTVLQEMIMRLPQRPEVIETFHNPNDANVRNALFMALKVLTRRELTAFGVGSDWWYIAFITPVKRGLELFRSDDGIDSDIYNQTKILYNKLVAKFDNHQLNNYNTVI